MIPSAAPRLSLHGAIPVGDSTSRGFQELVPGRRPARPLERPVLFPGAGIYDGRDDFATVGTRRTTRFSRPWPREDQTRYALLRAH